jgi:hypothetical protein
MWVHVCVQVTERGLDDAIKAAEALLNKEDSRPPYVHRPTTRTHTGIHAYTQAMHKEEHASRRERLLRPTHWRRLWLGRMHARVRVYVPVRVHAGRRRSPCFGCGRSRRSSRTSSIHTSRCVCVCVGLSTCAVHVSILLRHRGTCR